jgi:hypothetical protein
VFFDIEKVFNTTWHSGLYKLSELKFLTSLIKLIVSFLTDRKSEVLIEGEFFTLTIIMAGISQGSVFAPILCSLYINDGPSPPGSYLSLFADDTCIYLLEKCECHVLCKLQHGFSAVKCEHWNVTSECLLLTHVFIRC